MEWITPHNRFKCVYQHNYWGGSVQSLLVALIDKYARHDKVFTLVCTDDTPRYQHCPKLSGKGLPEM